MIYPTKKIIYFILLTIKSLGTLFFKKKNVQIFPEKFPQIKKEVALIEEETVVANDKIIPKNVEEFQTKEFDLLPQFIHGEANIADDENTKKVRDYIKYEFGLNFATDCLQCVEYVQYKIKHKLGIWIDWPIKSGRDAKYWPNILASRYKVSETPVVNSVASFDAPSLGVHGHVVFVENVFPNGDIEISEVNLPRDGIYNLKILSPEIWHDRYNGKFIIFS